MSYCFEFMQEVKVFQELQINCYTYGHSQGGASLLETRCGFRKMRKQVGFIENRAEFLY